MDLNSFFFTLFAIVSILLSEEEGINITLTISYTFEFTEV